MIRLPKEQAQNDIFLTVTPPFPSLLLYAILKWDRAGLIFGCRVGADGPFNPFSAL